MHLCSSCNRRTKIQWWWWWWWFIPQKKSQSVLKIQQDALAGFENCFTAGRKEEGDKKRIKEGDLWRSLTSCAPTFQPGANNNNDNNVRLLQLQSERYNRTNIYPVKLSGFFPRCMECRRGLAMRKVSVCQTRALWQNGWKICPDFCTIRKIT